MKAAAKTLVTDEFQDSIRRKDRNNSEDLSEKEENSKAVATNIPYVSIVSDQLFTENVNFQFLQRKQTGNVSGHYWKIDGVPLKLSASAVYQDSKAVFNMYTLMYQTNNKTLELHIVESVAHPRKVIAFDKSQNKAVVKTCSMDPIKFRNIQQVLKNDPDILLIRHSVENSPTYASYQFYTPGSTTYYGLGFGSNGKPLTPSTVSQSQAESIFSFHRLST